jgi:hypothetical protein
MGKAGRIERYRYEVGNSSYKLFSKAGEVEEWIGDLTPEGEVEAQVQTISVPARTRRSYPGGPAIAVQAHTRRTLTGGAATLATLPGSNATIEYEVSEGTETKVESITITFTSSFTDLYQFVQSAALNSFTLRSPDGTPYKISPVE